MQSPIQIETYVITWSTSQKCFHIETIKQMLATNQHAFKHKSELDFIVLGFAATNEAAQAIADTLRAQRQ